MGNSTSIDELSVLFLHVVNRFNELEKIPYFTGSEKSNMVLHLSEVHMVEAIGKNEDINVTKLAKLQGVSKAAISQMLRKLIKKGLVEKNISPETENEVVLRLTEKGKDIFEYHRQYHERLNHELAMICTEMPEEIIDHLGDFGKKMEKVFDKIIEERTLALKKSLNNKHKLR